MKNKLCKRSLPNKINHNKSAAKQSNDEERANAENVTVFLQNPLYISNRISLGSLMVESLISGHVTMLQTRFFVVAALPYYWEAIKLRYPEYVNK